MFGLLFFSEKAPCAIGTARFTIHRQFPKSAERLLATKQATQVTIFSGDNGPAVSDHAAKLSVSFAQNRDT